MVDVSDEELSMVIIDEDDDDIEVNTIQTNNAQIVSSKPETNSDENEHEHEDVSEIGSSLPSTIAVSGDFIFKPGVAVWYYDPENEHKLRVPGTVLDIIAGEMVTVQNVTTLEHHTLPAKELKHRKDFVDFDDPTRFVDMDDMLALSDLHESSVFWNIKRRYEQNKIYTFVDNILVSVNPYKMFEIYGLNEVKRAQTQLLNNHKTCQQQPHLFAVGNFAYTKMFKDAENQSIVIMGESGSGKTENTKLLLQYLAAINKSPSNIITEQILESIPLLESFGNAKTTRNNNSSRYCKYIEVYFNSGVIGGARTLEFLHEKSRIVAHNQDERSFHIFYELLEGLSEVEKEKYGLQIADKYFYLNQGGTIQVDGKDDAEDFRFLLSAMQVLGFTSEEQDIIFRILASILHLGNVYFHRKQFRHGAEGVEIGSDAEIRWVSHLLQMPIEDIYNLLTVRCTESRGERILAPLNIDQALDMRDAFAKVLYVSLFMWIVHRINKITNRQQNPKSKKIAILDMFGFENFEENSFEQLCINFASETAFQHYIRCVFRAEQQEYLREKIEWTPVDYPDNIHILNLIAKKPIGVFSLLEDESNFPKASDASFLEKCNYNHALNDIYSRARPNKAEFAIRHFGAQVWYCVDGFLEKNRDILKCDIIDTLLMCKMPIIHKIFSHARDSIDIATGRSTNRAPDGRFITMKPRAPTVSAKFQESLIELFDTAAASNPWFIRCVRPNNSRTPMLFDDRVVLDQLKRSALVETVRVKQQCWQIRMKYAQFVSRYHSFLTSQLPRGTPSKELAKLIIEKKFAEPEPKGVKFGFSKIFLDSDAEEVLESDRRASLEKAAIKIQTSVRVFLARKRYQTQRRSAIKIQAAYRGYRLKKRYNTLRKGVARLQATFKRNKQVTEFEKLKKAIRKRETEARLAEKLKEGNLLNGQAPKPAPIIKAIVPEPESVPETSQSVPVQSEPPLSKLSFPPELQNILDDADSWKCCHAYNEILKNPKQVTPLKSRHSLPYDLDSHTFTKFTNIYFRNQVFACRHDPISTAFLQKSSDKEVTASIGVFKLILRFMFDCELRGKREKLLADYIVQRGLALPSLRDEILVQICNQTVKNDNPESCDRAWTLMVHCLSSFGPSALLYKYLLKYVTDSAPTQFKQTLQRLILSTDKNDNTRTYPGSLLEWKANLKKCGMSVDVSLTGIGNPATVQVDSWTTAEQVVQEILATSGHAVNTSGWSLDLDDAGDIYSLNGGSYVLDYISQMEIPDNFPASTAYFIAAQYPNREDDILYNHFHDPTLMNRFVPEISKPDAKKMARSMSENVIPGLGLALGSKLNQRYLKKPTSLMGFNKLVEEDEDSAAEVQLAQGSRLNQRYLLSQKDKNFEPKKQQPNRKNLYTRKSDRHASKLAQQRSMSMQELGLASNSSLNIRYFSRDKLNKTSSLTGSEDDGSETMSKVQSLVNFRDRYSGVSERRSGQRPPSNSSTNSSAFESDSSSCAAEPNEDSKSANSRYRKYGPKSRYMKSSAMSDTSEAPSLASHVRNLRIPSHNSELDQYLDDLFNPVLDAQLDDAMSDARSLAQSIKGFDLSDLQDPKKLSTKIMGDIETKTGTATNLESGLSGSNLNLQLDSGILQQQVLQQQMLQMQQRAFLASSLQQNLEIQKQLLQQNEQLQMLLAQTVGTPTPTPPVTDSNLINRSTSLSSVAFPISPIPNPIFGSNPMLSTLPEGQNAKNDANKGPKISILSPVVGNGNGQIPPPPPPPPPMSPGTDVFGRAKTVRIGKWRWPPPAESGEGQAPSNNFIEFKRKKQLEKDSSKNSSEISGNTSCSDFKSSTDSSAVDIQFEVQKKELIMTCVATSSTASSSSETARNDKGDKENVARKFSDTSNSTPVPGSVGKLRISSEMRAKLEQLTIDQTVRGPKKGVTGTKEQVSQSMDDLAGMSSVKKLSEQRKALLERQLMGSLRNTANFMETASTPNIKQIVDGAPEVQEAGAFMGHKKLVQENSASSAGYDPPSHVKKFLKNQPEQLRKSGSREFRERREELGFSRLSSSAVHVNYPPEMRPLYTPDRYFQSQQNVNNSSFQAEVESGRPSSSSGRYFSGRKQLVTPNSDHHPVEHKIDKLFMKNEINFYTYSKPKFRLNLRKEFFTPNEHVENPILVEMIFWQIVRDCFTPNCLRLNQTEQQHLFKMLKSEGISSYAPHPHGPKASFKRAVIETAKSFNIYFSRLHVVTGTKRFGSMDYLAVSHNGVSAVRRDKSTPKCDELIVLERIPFEEIKEVCVPEQYSLQIVYRDEWATFYTKEAANIQALVQKMIQELRHSKIEYVRTIREYVANDQSSLSYAKDTIIRIIKNKHVHLQKGWLYGTLDSGESGIFQMAHTVPLTASEIDAHIQLDGDGDTKLRNASVPDLNGYQHSKHDEDSHSDDAQHHRTNPDFGSLWIDNTPLDERDDERHQNGHRMDENNHSNNGDTQNSLQNGTMSQYGESNFSLLQFAMFNFREPLAKYDMRGHLKEGSIRGSIKMIENMKTAKKNKNGKKSEANNDWTWSEFASLVKYTNTPIQSSLLMMPPDLSKVATECFASIMRYMGDLPMGKSQNEVDCVYTILVNCHKYIQIRDEIYCQLMKQTTSNKSPKPDSCQRGWRLFSIVAAYFDCSEALQPYLFKYLETAAFDKRRAFHVTASIALGALKKTFKYGGRKNVPSIEEIAAISAGRTSKRQMYRLPGGTERVLNTTCTTVVADIIDEICGMLSVNSRLEMEEFSLYCIIEGDPFTMPLARDEYILDVTTELLKNGQLFYLIFCRSVWYYPLRLDSDLYIEVVFNQVAPDYLEGLLIILPSQAEAPLPEDTVEQIARIAALLHKAAEMDTMPTKDEIKYLLPKPVLTMRTVKPQQWVETVQAHWTNMSALSTIEAKAQCLDILQKWPLFGSCFFAVKRIQNDSHVHPEHILALNKDGVHFLDMTTHEKVWRHPFSEVISTRKVRSEDGTLYLDMKCGNLMVQKITRIQTDQAHEISRLIRQYIEIEQHFKNGRNNSAQDNASNIELLNH